MDVEPVAGALRRPRFAADQRAVVGAHAAPAPGRESGAGPDRRHGFGGGVFRPQKKNPGQYSARRAALGGRTLQCGQSRFVVGYQQPTVRLWLRHDQRGVLLVPPVSWIAPATSGAGRFLSPSVIHWHQRWQWHPHLIVADMGDMEAGTKAALRQSRQIAVVTRCQGNMRLVTPVERPEHAGCAQGQRLEWLGYEATDQRHWVGVTAPEARCGRCWAASRCVRQFRDPPAAHETLFGGLPMHTRARQRRLKPVRPWSAPVQAHENNQLGWNEVFRNSLRWTWIRALRADAAVLWRARVLLDTPLAELPMFGLTPRQLALDLPM